MLYSLFSSFVGARQTMALFYCVPYLWELGRQWLYLIVLRACGSKKDNVFISLFSMFVGARKTMALF